MAFRVPFPVLFFLVSVVVIHAAEPLIELPVTVQDISDKAMAGASVLLF